MAEYPLKLDLNKLKEEMHLSDEVIEASRFSKEDLQTIYQDYVEHRLDELEELKNRFVSQYIVSAKNLPFHSYSGRVKDPYHLIEKIIRKRSTNDVKYGDMLASDYYKYITDLIGCRILLVYKRDWEKVHNHLTSFFPNDASRYIDCNHFASSYDAADASTSHPYMAEPPVAHTRLGDPEIYQNKLKVLNNHYYRSLHYVLRYGTYYVEIQVRTLFDEAWGEVDHDVLYPYHKSDKVLVGFSQLLNRVAGTGDEMSAYFKDVLLPERPIEKSSPLDVPRQPAQTLTGPPSLGRTSQSHSSAMPLSASPGGATPGEILGITLYGDLGKIEGEA